MRAGGWAIKVSYVKEEKRHKVETHTVKVKHILHGINGEFKIVKMNF